jgi:hypothetical protein
MAVAEIVTVRWNAPHGILAAVKPHGEAIALVQLGHLEHLPTKDCPLLVYWVHKAGEAHTISWPKLYAKCQGDCLKGTHGGLERYLG